jgi:hypothetical protein
MLMSRIQRAPIAVVAGPALTLSVTLSARDGADGQAVVCPLLRGSSPTRGVAPKQHLALTFLVALTRAREVFPNSLGLHDGTYRKLRSIELRFEACI